MSRSNNYKWLIVVEGISDVGTYKNLLAQFGVAESDINLFSADGKTRVCKTSNWGKIGKNGGTLLNTLINDIGRSDFSGIMLVVDSDMEMADSFKSYDRSPSSNLLYIDPICPTAKEIDNSFWELDFLNGFNRIPVVGINVPFCRIGGLETELLSAYGFPIKMQPEYDSFDDIIQKASDKWGIPNLRGGGKWWEENKDAKIDKFIYTALYRGFIVCCDQKPVLANEPEIIKNIKKAIDYYQAI